VADAAVEFEALARALREAGEKGLAQELRKGINEAARPLPDEIRASLIPHMPDTYAATLNHDLRITISQRPSGTSPGVSVVAKASGSVPTVSRRNTGRKLKRLDTGLLSHPVFGDRKVWRTQGPEGGGMRPGWFSDPVNKARPRVRQQIEDAVRRVRDKIYQTP
jgi:hypothetical protein